MDKHSSLNKIGHALHYINPVFRKISFSQKVQMISRSLSLRDPAIVQGMYIFKNPGIGREEGVSSQLSFTKFILTVRWPSDPAPRWNISLQRTSQTVWFLVSNRWCYWGEWLSLVCPRQSQRASHQEISQNWSGGGTAHCWLLTWWSRTICVLYSRWAPTNSWSLKEKTNSGRTLPGWQPLSRVGPWSSYTARSTTSQSRTPVSSPGTPTPFMSSRLRALTTPARTGSSLPRSLCRDFTSAPGMFRAIRIMENILNKTIFAEGNHF